MSGNDDHPNASKAVDQLADTLLAERSLHSVLQTAADLTKQVLPAHPEASVSLLVADKPTSLVYTGQLALDLDESQYGRGYGPCLEAARGGTPTEIPDARTEARWPDYIQVAVARGCLSSLSLPLKVPDPLAAGINIYARQPDAFDEGSRSIAARIAHIVGVAVSNMYGYQSARTRAENLQMALQSRAVIERAKGILMERFRLTPDQAFQTLSRVSMKTNTKLRDVAERLVETGELPGLPGRS